MVKIECPKCGHKFPAKKTLKKWASKGGSVSSEAKSAAAKAREERKRKERGEG